MGEGGVLALISRGRDDLCGLECGGVHFQRTSSSVNKYFSVGLGSKLPRHDAVAVRACVCGCERACVCVRVSVCMSVCL